MSFPTPAESSAEPSSDGNRGDLQSPQTASGVGEVVSRIVRVPLERPDDAVWRDLVDLAREGAAFANGIIAGWWAEAHGWQPKEGQSTFKDFKGRLSGDARVAIQGEAMGVWRRLKSRILRRDQRLPAFAADRGLVVRGRYASGPGGVRVQRTGDGVEIRLLLRGADHGGWQTFAVWPSALVKDRYLAGLLDKMASGAYRCSKVTVQIDVKRRKLYALCAYDRPVPTRVSGDRTATLGPLEPDGSLLLRSAWQTRDFTRDLWEIREKKTHYEGIVRRFRRSVGRGPRWRQVYRRALPPTYEAWATGKLHQMSAAMIAWCASAGVSTLTIRRIEDGDWPAHQLVTMLTYKAQHVGMAVEMAKAEPESVVDVRAEMGPVRKEMVKAKRVRQVARLVTDDLRERKRAR